MENGNAPAWLHQTWLHSHEEDSDDAVVYRPATHRFPPARGRSGLELRPDGTAIVRGIGATDKTELREGRWSAPSPHEIRVGLPMPGASQTLRVIESSPDILKVAR